MSGKSRTRFLKNTAQTKRRKWLQAVKVSLRILILALILFLSGYSAYYAQNSPHFELRKIHYEGLVHVDPEALDNMIRKVFPRNILLVDLDRMRGLVESESWVRRAHIRRQLPNQLFIYVEERQASALATIDGELYLVDSEGIILDRSGPRYDAIDKPIVRGLKNVARENARHENRLRMALYLRVLNELKTPQKDYSQSVSEINVQDLERLAIIPADEPVPVYLGRERFLQRYQTFLAKKDLYRQLKEQYGRIESVDVSYDNKMIFHTPQESGGTVVSSGSDYTDYGKEEIASNRD